MLPYIVMMLWLMCKMGYCLGILFILRGWGHDNILEEDSVEPDGSRQKNIPNSFL